MDLFGFDIAAEVASAFEGQLITGTLIKVSAGARTPGALTGGANPTEASYSFNGIIMERSDTRKNGTLVSEGGQSALVLGGSLPAGIIPEQNDKIVLEGTTFRIIEVPKRDPAAATYECAIEV